MKSLSGGDLCLQSWLDLATVALGPGSDLAEEPVVGM